MTTWVTNGLSRRERQIMDVLYRLGRATAAEIIAELPGKLSSSTVRTQLRVLERKGHVRHDDEGQRFVFSPTLPRRDARKSALRHLVETFYDGSAEKVVAAVLGGEGARMSDASSNASRRWSRKRGRRHGDEGLRDAVDWFRRARTAAAAIRRGAPLGARRHDCLCGGASGAPVDRAVMADTGAAVQCRYPRGFPVSTTIAVSMPRESQTRSAAAPARPSPPAAIPVFQWVARIQTAGALAGVLLLLVGLLRLQWIATRARPVTDGRLAMIWRETLDTLAISRPVRLLETDHTPLLMTWGVIRPIVVLPRSANHWTDARVRAVLVHELAHVRRGDWLI